MVKEIGPALFFRCFWFCDMFLLGNGFVSMNIFKIGNGFVQKCWFGKESNGLKINNYSISLYTIKHMY
jgi:hypothetical protein